MAGTISVGKAQAKGPHPAFPSCPVAFCHLREAGEYWLWLQGSWVSAVHSGHMSKTKDKT